LITVCPIIPVGLIVTSAPGPRILFRSVAAGRALCLLLGQKEPAGGFGSRSFRKLVLGPYFLAFLSPKAARNQKGRPKVYDWLWSSGPFLPRKPLVSRRHPLPPKAYCRPAGRSWATWILRVTLPLSPTLLAGRRVCRRLRRFVWRGTGFV